MPTAAVNGIDLSYDDTGGAGPVVVLSHGYLMDHSMFGAQVAALSPRYRVITWDERGHGPTSSPGPFTYWDSARDLLALLDHLGIDRAVLGGMSQGGFVSMRAAMEQPDRVRGLILIDTQAGTEDPAMAPSYEQMFQIWIAQGPEPVQELVSAMILGPGQWPDWYAKWAVLDDDQATYAFRCLMDRDDITDKIGEITAPALIIHGTEDASIPMSKAEELRDGLGGKTTLAVIEGGTHASNISHPDEVNAHMLAFLSSLDD